jgi:hypothetical protein
MLDGKAEPGKVAIDRTKSRPASARRKADSPLMMGASWVRFVRRITVPQRQARQWTGRTFHVKHGI